MPVARLRRRSIGNAAGAGNPAAGRNAQGGSGGPRGAREVRRAAYAFLEMKSRVERSIEQRTAMLAGVVTFYRHESIERLRNPVQLFDAAGLALLSEALFELIGRKLAARRRPPAKAALALQPRRRSATGKAGSAGSTPTDRKRKRRPHPPTGDGARPERPTPAQVPVKRRTLDLSEVDPDAPDRRHPGS